MSASTEYNMLIDRANSIKESREKRLAIIAVYGTTMCSMVEKMATKPFNPLLGETYELITDDFELIAE